MSRAIIRAIVESGLAFVGEAVVSSCSLVEVPEFLEFIAPIESRVDLLILCCVDWVIVARATILLPPGRSGRQQREFWGLNG